MSRLDQLQAVLEGVLGGKLKKLVRRLDEITITVSPVDYMTVAMTLRDDPLLAFEQLIDLCGMDYSGYKDQPWEGPRFAVVTHLLSIRNNWRVRLKVFAADDDMPTVDSMTAVWSGANWFER